MVKSIPALLSRVAVGWVFIESGWGKLHRLDDVIGFFTSLGIPFANIQAPFVAGLELVCGVMLLIGLFARFAAIPLIPIMIVAIATTKLGDIKAASDLYSMSEFLYILIAVWIIAFGAGQLSLDELLKRRKKKPNRYASSKETF